MTLNETRYRLVYPATITIEVDAETLEAARQFAQQDVIGPLCDGSMVRREIWVDDISVANATVQVDTAADRSEGQS